jgi:hypothetical protein
VRAALAPYTTVPDDEQFRVVPLVELVDEVPMLRDPPGAACVTAGRLGVGACWEVSTASGERVARAVGAPFGSTRVPERMLARPDRYHQEWIGSGDGVNGWVDNDKLEVLIRGRETLVVVAEVPGVAVSDYYSGRALLERLFLRDVVKPSGSARFWLPTWLPDGVMRMTGRVHDWENWPPGEEPDYVEYGTARGQTLRVQRYHALPAVGETIDLNGLPGRLISEGRRVSVMAAGPWQIVLGAQSDDGFDADTLRRVLGSIPRVTARRDRSRWRHWRRAPPHERRRAAWGCSPGSARRGSLG